MSKRSLTILWVIVLGGWIALTLVNLYRGQLNQDEGWYLYAAGLVSSGDLPYIDFCYTQGPVLPFVYVLATGWVESSGVLGGRVFTLLLSILCLACSVGLARRLAPTYSTGMASMLVVCLLGLNVFHNYYSLVVKTYSLAALFLMAGFYVLSYVFSKNGRSMAFAAGVLFALAVGTRVSSVAVMPLICVYLWLVRGQAPWVWLWFGLAGAGTCGALFLPFWAIAPESFWFSMVDYHGLREVGSFSNGLFLKTGFLALVIQSYFVMLVLFVAGLVARATGIGAQSNYEPGGIPASFRGMMWACFFAVSALHFIAPFPYHEYQVMIMPVLAVLLSVGCCALCGERVGNRSLWLSVVVVLMSCMSVASSSMLQGWMMRGMDRLWPDMREQSAIAQLDRAAATLESAVIEKGLDPETSVLLTQDLYLAVQAGMRVPRGMEMGPFCYMPDFTREQAEARHVLNAEMLRELLAKTTAPVAAVSGYGFSVSSPAVMDLGPDERLEWVRLLEERYEVMGDATENFGQNDTQLRVYRLR